MLVNNLGTKAVFFVNMLNFVQVQHSKQITDCFEHGRFRKLNETWMEGCHTKKCNVHGRQGKIEYTAFGCDDGGKCRTDREEWNDGCNKKKCIVGEKKIKIRTQIGCDDNGKCRKPYETWKEGCNSKICLAEDCEEGLIVDDKFGCFDDEHEVCREKDEEWFVMSCWDCDHKICKVELDATKGFAPRISDKGKGCLDNNGNCHAVGDTGFPYRNRSGKEVLTNCTCRPNGVVNCLMK